MNRSFFILLCMHLCCAAAWCLESAELDSVLRQFEAEEVVITASRVSSESAGVQRLSGEALHCVNALNVADALRYFSGVQLKDYGGVGGVKTINVRSMGSEQVGVYYDGIQLGNAQNGQVDLGRFSLEQMEQVSLYHGQRVNSYQSAREYGSASSIYLETRRPRFVGKEKVHARVQMRAGSFALANPSLGVDVRLAEGLLMTLNAEYVYSDGRYKFRYKRVTPDGQVAYDTTAVRENGDVNAVRTEVGLHHYYSSTGYWRLHGYNYWSERGVPGAIVNNVWRNGERLQDRNSFVQGQWQDEWWGRWHTRLNMKYANDYTHYRNNDMRLLPQDNVYLQQEVYVSLVNKVDLLEGWDMSVAYDYQYNTLRREERLFGSEQDFFDRHSHWLALATNYRYGDWIEVQASGLMTSIEKTNKVTPALVMNCHPLAGMQLPYAKGLNVNIFYKQSYRYPTFNDLYYTDMGNATLRPEWARQRNVGVSYACTTKGGTQVRVSADCYYNRVSDKIVAYPKGQQFRWTMLNLGDVKINGTDVRADVTVAIPSAVGQWALPISLTYTYQKAIDVTNEQDSYYGDQIPYIPHHSGTASVGVDYTSKRGNKYALRYSFVYVGERYSQQENIVYNYVQPWYTHDMALIGEWGVRKHTLRAQVEVNNLLGQDYEVIAGYPMPKQNIRCTFAVIY